jgi:hypothetical protein
MTKLLWNMWMRFIADLLSREPDKGRQIVLMQERDHRILKYTDKKMEYFADSSVSILLSP